MSDLELLRANFRLEGEILVRIKGGPVASKSRKSYQQVSVVEGSKRRVFRVHRVKFALAHGYFPPTVDHRNRNRKDDSLGNPRPATKAQNGSNTKRPSRGVRQKPSGKWQAYGFKSSRQVHLGSYETEGQALEAAASYRRSQYGEFYAGQ